MRQEPLLPASLRYRVLRLAVVAVAVVTCAFHWQTARADTVIHVVQPGENLFRIGLKYGVSWVAIMDANGLADTTIYVGQQLVIPDANVLPYASALPAATQASPAEATPTGVGAQPTPAPPGPVAETPAPPLEGAAGGGAYTVQTGDTLFRIAASHGVSLAELAAANNIYNPALIYAGQTLIIPGAASASAGNPSSDKQIVVSISQQHLYAYENGNLVYSFIASTGEPGSDTWTGSYSVLDKIPDAYGANWDLWMPNWLGVYWAGTLENGIHALPILSNGQRLWDGYLGTPVSYGCIILGVDDSQTLYDWAELGTPVYIRP